MNSCFLLENICIGKTSSKSDGSLCNFREKLGKRDGTCLGAARAGGRREGRQECGQKSRADRESRQVKGRWGKNKGRKFEGAGVKWWWLDQFAYH